MVFVTGDCHADFTRFSTRNFPEQKTMTRDDIVIVCGDFGGVWQDSQQERYWLKWLGEKEFTIAFVDGNHENFDRLYGGEFPIVEFHGGMAHKIRDNIFHLMRGCVFDFEGKTFFTFGGAKSHDTQDGILDEGDFENKKLFSDTVLSMRRQRKLFRINHVSWWEEELPSQDEIDYGVSTLNENGNSVDFIISHCCPHEVALFCGFRDPDILTMWFNTVAHTVKFNKWYFGHYHQNTQVFSKFVMLYERIERVL